MISGRDNHYSTALSSNCHVVLISPTGTTAFIEELGRMTWLSYPVIVLPSMLVLFFAIWFIFSSISKLTGRERDSFLNQP